MLRNDARNAWRSGDMLEIPMPEMLERTWSSFVASGVSSVKPRLAATVMLVRSPSEVFMLRRAKTMAFVPEAVVFPGGGVDPRDADERLPWAGPQPDEWAHRMGADEHTARCVISAAAREVFEECGVLLAGERYGSVVSDTSLSWLDEERQRLVEHESSFAEVLIRHGLVLRSDLLGLRSHWLTPRFEPRRYDTYFFAALAPVGQIADDHTSEATKAGWVNPQWILKQAEKGETRLVPPTIYNLTHFAYASNVDEFAQGVNHTELIMLEPESRPHGSAVLRCRLP